SDISPIAPQLSCCAPAPKAARLARAPRQAALLFTPKLAPPSRSALALLQRTLTQDAAQVPGLSSARQRHYRMFHDIARVVLSRGGIAYGQRDEFIFWMLVTRFNAGLYALDELEQWAESFSGLSQGHLNLWQEGMLSSLYR